MRKNKIFFLLVFFISFFFSITGYSTDKPKGVTINQDGSDYLVNFKMPDYSMKPVHKINEDYIKIVIDNYGITNQPGYPCLPQITFNLYIGDKENQPGKEIIYLNKEIKLLSNKLYPVQAPWLKIYSPDDRPFNIDRNYYNTRGIESPFVTISEPFIIGGVKGVRITITPFSYNPVENKLTLINEGSFRIKFNYLPSTHTVHSVSFNDFLSRIFVNYETNDASPTGNFLIITSPNFESGMLPFVIHKTNLGYNVTMASTNVTGNTGADIKNYIQQKYNNPSTRPEFILLVGDVDKIPEWIGNGYQNPHTDLNYSLLDGNDLYPDAFLGRYSVSNTTELSNLINKTILMETNINTLPKKGIFMASNDYYNITEATQNFVINSFFAPDAYSYQKLFVHTYGATTQQLINALNGNQTFAIYSGHGSTSSWDDGPPLSTPQVMALTNTVYPFVYSFACLTGQFESTICFGETWTRIPNGGTVFFGATMSSYWDEDDIFERKVFTAMFPDGLIKASPMFLAGKIYLIQYYGGNITPVLQRYLEMYNCLGDPSLYEAIYGPTITHTGLHDTENLNGPYAVNCTIFPHGSNIDVNKTKVIWTRGSIFTDSVSLINTGGNNWSTAIPGNGTQAIYKYYIKTADLLNRVNVQPLGAPGQYYSFRAMPDTIKPCIFHVPIQDIPLTQWPALVSANVTDNISIDSAWVRWYKNIPSAGIKHFKLNNISGTIYSSLFNSDINQISVNDSIFYRVFARDNSSNHCTDSTALFKFKITGITNVCIGNGSVPVPHPFNTYYKSNRTDILFLANEIIAAGGNNGSINRIGFNVVSASPQLMQNFTIKMQHTNLTSINGLTETGWSVVYYGSYAIPGPGIQFISLQNPFLWNGSQNLLIEICFADSVTTSTSTVNSTILPGKTWAQRQDNLLGCSLTGGSPVDGRPNICFEMNILVGNGQVNITNPEEFSLFQNYPNPFNPATTIKYSIPQLNRFSGDSKEIKVNLTIYDVLGKMIKTLVNEIKQSGNYSVSFDGTEYSSGIYFYCISAETNAGQVFSDVKKLVLIK